jgi:hypothetical protein
VCKNGEKVIISKLKSCNFRHVDISKKLFFLSFSSEKWEIPFPLGLSHTGFSSSQRLTERMPS